MNLTILIQILLTIAFVVEIYDVWDTYAWQSSYDESFWPNGVGATICSILVVIVISAIWYIPYYGVPEWLNELIKK